MKWLDKLKQKIVDHNDDCKKRNYNNYKYSSRGKNHRIVYVLRKLNGMYSQLVRLENDISAEVFAKEAKRLNKYSRWITMIDNNYENR